MAEHKKEESLMDKITEKFHGDDGSSSSDSDGEKTKASSTSEAVKAKIYRLFGHEKTVHEALGGGKSADVLLWRNKKVSGAVIGGATAIWVLFELMESPPNIPVVSISEDLAMNVARAQPNDINRLLATLRDVALGHDLKKFLGVIASLWFLSILGNCFNFLTLFYIGNATSNFFIMIFPIFCIFILRNFENMWRLLHCIPSLSCMRNTRIRLIHLLRKQKPSSRSTGRYFKPSI